MVFIRLWRLCVYMCVCVCVCVLLQVTDYEFVLYEMYSYIFKFVNIFKLLRILKWVVLKCRHVLPIWESYLTYVCSDHDNSSNWEGLETTSAVMLDAAKIWWSFDDSQNELLV